jgi:Xaa-Pro dipeptidase
MVPAEALAGADVPGLVSTAPADVAWATGFAVPHESWPSPRDVGFAVVADRDGTVLVAPELFVELGQVAPDIELRTYRSHDLSPRLGPTAALADAVATAVAVRGLVGAPLLVNAGLPMVVAASLAPARLVAREDPTAPDRRRKSAVEIERIRVCAAACDRFQASVRDRAEPGRAEVEVFAAARAELESAVGSRTTILGDLVSGERTLDGGGPPGARRLRPGDALLCDVAISLDGYWADNCAAVAVGEAGRELRRTADAVLAALELAMERCCVGALTGEVDAAARGLLGERGLGFGHHLGHGIGAAYHEAPRLVPTGDERLEESMVVCLEPAATEGTPAGVRMEVVGVVRADGFECLGEMPCMP